MEPGIYMDWVVDKSFLLPYPSTSGEGYLDRLLHIKSAHGLDAVVPNLDAELPFYIKYAGQLAERGIRTFLPTPSPVPPPRQGPAGGIGREDRHQRAEDGSGLLARRAAWRPWPRSACR